MLLDATLKLLLFSWQYHLLLWVSLAPHYERFQNLLTNKNVTYIIWNAPNYVDLAPPYAGLLHGLCDTLQSCAGFIIPVCTYKSNFDQKVETELISYLDYDGSSHQWKLDNDQRVVAFLVHYCTDPNIFIAKIIAAIIHGTNDFQKYSG